MADPAHDADSLFAQTVVVPALDQLETLVIGRDVQVFSALPSTSTLLAEQARRGMTEGTIIIADEQTAGRGRRGRGWTAPPGTNVLLSVLLRPTWLEPRDAWVLTMLAAVALAEAIERCTPLVPTLKWPNDVQINGHKLAGILVDLELDAGALRWAIIGCGINVNWHPDARIATATSIARELGQPFDRATLLRALLVAFDQQYLALRSGRREALRAAWRARLQTIGQVVRVEGGSTFDGIAEDVDAGGALLVRLESGELRRVLAGDVSVRPHTANSATLDQSSPNDRSV